MSDEIQYAAIIKDNEFKGEVGDSNAEGGRGQISLRAVALSIAAQATPGDVACVTSNQVVGYYVKRSDDSTVSIALSTKNTPPRLMLSFLKSVDGKLSEAINRGGSSSSSSGSVPEYNKILVEAASEVNRNKDSIQLAKADIDRVRQIMVENIDRLLERGERVNLLVDRTGEMSQSANLFNRESASLQRYMWLQNVKMTVIGVGLLCGISYIAFKVFT